jgi:hypothetical protein
MGDADERQHVVLAHGVHGNRAGQHQLVVRLIVGKRGQLERARREHLGVRAGHPARRRTPALGVHRLAESREERFCGSLGSGQIDRRRVVQHPQRSRSDIGGRHSVLGECRHGVDPWAALRA